MKREEREMINESIKNTQEELSGLYHLFGNLEHEALEEIMDEISDLQDKLHTIDWKFPDVEDE